MAPALDDAELELEKEVDRIQKTAEKQLASVHGLNVSLVKKIRKSEAQTAALLTENKGLEDKNADLVAQLSRSKEEIRVLLIRAEALDESEKNLAEAKKTVVATELAVKKTQASLDSVTAEKDALDSEIGTLKTRLDTANTELNEAREAAETERQTLNSTVEERGLALAAVTSERDDAAKEKANLEESIKEREQELEKLNQQIASLTAEKDTLKADTEVEITALKELSEKTAKESEQKSRDLTVATTDRDSLQESKSKLEGEIAALSASQVELQEKYDASEKSLTETKDSLDAADKELTDLKDEHESKVAELAAVTASVAALTGERDDLTKRGADLEKNLADSQKETETVKNELEAKATAFTSIESERNLLTSEKASLEKDYTETRDRSTVLEREKSTFEKRVYELEESEKKLYQSIEALELEKAAMIEAHSKELQQQLLKKEEEYAIRHAELRKELDDVVDRHAALSRSEVESEPTAMRSFPVAADGSGTVGDTDAVGNVSLATDEAAGKVVGTGIEDASAEPADIQRAIALEAPVEMPKDPVMPGAVPAQGREFGGATMVAVREDEEDEDDEEEEEEDYELAGDHNAAADKKETGPGEGNTAGVVSEEVLKEMVVDDVKDDVLEVVGEEVPVTEAEAADARKGLSFGMKSAADGAEKITDVGDVTGEGVVDIAVDGAKVTGAAVGDQAKSTGEGVKESVQTGVAATANAATKVATGVKDGVGTGVATTRDAAGAAVEGSKKATGGFLRSALCCTRSESAGDNGAAEPSS